MHEQFLQPLYTYNLQSPVKSSAAAEMYDTTQIPEL